MTATKLSESETLAKHAQEEIDTIARQAKDRAEQAIAAAMKNLQRQREEILAQLRQSMFDDQIE